MTPQVAIRPCRVEECEAVLALWRRAGAIPSVTDTLEELTRLVRSEHGDGFLVAVRDGGVVGSVIGGWDGWRGGVYPPPLGSQGPRRGLPERPLPAGRSGLLGRGARRGSGPGGRHQGP